MMGDTLSEVVHKELVDKKKDIRANYLSPMDVPIQISTTIPIFGVVNKASNKSLIPSKYEFKKMDEDHRLAMRLERIYQDMKAGNSIHMNANEFIKELARW